MLSVHAVLKQQFLCETHIGLGMLHAAEIVLSGYADKVRDSRNHT